VCSSDLSTQQSPQLPMAQLSIDLLAVRFVSRNLLAVC